MKPIELIKIHEDFTAAMLGDAIPSELKLRVAREVLLSIPAAFLCVSCPATREWLETAIVSVINKLQAENDRSNPTGTDTEAGTETAKASEDSAASIRQRKARKESVG